MDCVRKERHKHTVTAAEVREIRQLNHLHVSEVATRFGISASQAWRIRTGRARTHVAG